MLKASRTKAEQEGGDTMEHNYVIVNHRKEPMQLHGYGQYMSYSTAEGDFLHAAVAIEPYRILEVARVQTGTKHEVVKPVATQTRRERTLTGEVVTKTLWTGEETQSVIREVPLYETRRTYTTPPFTKYGKPIKEGDTVTFNKVAGRLETLTDTHFVITNDNGRHYFPWSDTSVRDRIKRTK